MQSLFDELDEKVKREPRLSKRTARAGNMPRADLGLLLFNARDDLRALWHAANDARTRAVGDGDVVLADRVERLRPIFGERS